MPLLPWKRNIGKNITELKASSTKRPMKQIVAIALNTAKVPKEKESVKENKLEPKGSEKKEAYGMKSARASARKLIKKFS